MSSDVSAFYAEKMPEFFTFLDKLKDSGEVNMLGACPYLKKEFDLDMSDSKEILRLWVKSKNVQTA